MDLGNFTGQMTVGFEDDPSKKRKLLWVNPCPSKQIRADWSGRVGESSRWAFSGQATSVCLVVINDKSCTENMAYASESFTIEVADNAKEEEVIANNAAISAAGAAYARNLAGGGTWTSTTTRIKEINDEKTEKKFTVSLNYYADKSATIRLNTTTPAYWRNTGTGDYNGQMQQRGTYWKFWSNETYYVSHQWQYQIQGSGPSGATVTTTAQTGGTSEPGDTDWHNDIA